MRNLLVGKPWKTSSTALTCNPGDHQCGGLTTDIFFHTNFEQNPWIEFDLGEPYRFSRMMVRNRQDMGPERAVPLIAEVSDDEKDWQMVVRRDDTFSDWEVSFPAKTARYFRLRADKKTWLHLEGVELYP
jgi:hypothetical protein